MGKCKQFTDERKMYFDNNKLIKYNLFDYSKFYSK